MIMEIQSGPLVMPNSLSLHLPFAILAYVKNKMRKERRRRRRTKNSFFFYPLAIHENKSECFKSQKEHKI